MTRDEIIKMAREAGFDQSNPHEALIVRHSNGSWIGITNRLERFVALVAAAERAACAKVCDAEGREWNSDDVVTEKNYAAHCAAAIRARGESDAS